MAITKITINANDTATIALTGNNDIKNLILRNDGSNVIYLGVNNLVTTSNGFPIYAGENMPCNDYIGNYYCICNTGETSTLIIEYEVV